MSPPGQRIAYLRVSSLDQKFQRQLDGETFDRIFTEQASGKSLERPVLQEMIAYVRQGDLLIVHSMDRLARNVDDLRQLVQRLNNRGVGVEFRKENLRFTGEESSVSHLMLSILGAVAQFERDLIRERQREGIALAKSKGVYRGRRRKLSVEQIQVLRHRIQSGESKAALARDYAISRETLYAALRREDC